MCHAPYPVRLRCLHVTNFCLNTFGSLLLQGLKLCLDSKIMTSVSFEVVTEISSNTFDKQKIVSKDYISISRRNKRKINKKYCNDNSRYVFWLRMSCHVEVHWISILCVSRSCILNWFCRCANIRYIDLLPLDLRVHHHSRLYDRITGQM